jgi:hypothetical protein
VSVFVSLFLSAGYPRVPTRACTCTDAAGLNGLCGVFAEPFLRVTGQHSNQLNYVPNNLRSTSVASSVPIIAHVHNSAASDTLAPS